jgi:cyclic beta-1,2-glucan synthetase
VGRGLQLFNGTGGFTPDGREYVIGTSLTQRPPAPWVNVIANPRFGTVVSDGGSSYSWCENAHELRLTPWHNDPVIDSGGEVSTCATRRPARCGCRPRCRRRAT